jgi:hypothetical protein
MGFGYMPSKTTLNVTDWNAQHSKAAHVLSALEGGEKTRAELLAIVGGSMQGLQTILQRLVIEGRVARVRPGRYALGATS